MRVRLRGFLFSSLQFVFPFTLVPSSPLPPSPFVVAVAAVVRSFRYVFFPSTRYFQLIKFTNFLIWFMVFVFSWSDPIYFVVEVPVHFFVVFNSSLAARSVFKFVRSAAESHCFPAVHHSIRPINLYPHREFDLYIVFLSLSSSELILLVEISRGLWIRVIHFLFFFLLSLSSYLFTLAFIAVRCLFTPLHAVRNLI